jgi:hypothetical protein
MDNLDLFNQVNGTSNSAGDYYELPKVSLIIECSQLKFSGSSRPADPDNYKFSNRKIEQALSGLSQPVNNENVLKDSINKKQEYTNNFFKNKEIFIHISESKRKDWQKDNSKRHFLHSYKNKNQELKISFYWEIDDRSLYTRLCLFKSNSVKIKLILRLSESESHFKQIGSTDLEAKNFMFVESVDFYFD